MNFSRKADSRIPTTGLGAVTSVFVIPVLALILLNLREPKIPFVEKLSNRSDWIGAARFIANGKSIAYLASWDSGPEQLYEMEVSLRTSKPIDPQDPRLGADNPCGLLASLRQSDKIVSPELPDAESSRETIECDRSSVSGEMAVVRRKPTGARLEFPPGRVLRSSAIAIWAPRVSPSGRRVAFVEQESDGLYRVSLADRNGRIQVPSRPWGFVNGLGWTPDEKEVWFAAGSDPRELALRAVTISGKERQLLPISGTLSVEDISSDGVLLFRWNSVKEGICVESPKRSTLTFSTSDRSLSIPNPESGDTVFSNEMWLTKRGHAIFSGLGRHNWTICARSVSDGHERMIAKGIGIAASPSGRAVLGRTVETPPHLFVQTVDGREPVPLKSGGLIGFSGGGWVGDEQHIYFSGQDREGVWRVYIQSVEGTDPVAITEPGATASVNSFSQDGRWLVVRAGDGRLSVRNVRGTMILPLPSLTREAILVGWEVTPKALLFAVPDATGAALIRVRLPDLRREKEGRITRKDLASVCRLTAVNRLGNGLAYSFESRTAALYLADGLR